MRLDNQIGTAIENQLVAMYPVLLRTRIAARVAQRLGTPGGSTSSRIVSAIILA